MRTPFLFFILFVAAAYGVDANFQNNHPGYGDKFDTDMSLTTSFTLSLVSGEMASGDSTDIETGDTVCSGAVLRITPSYNTKWAVTDVDIYTAYPDCDLSYCPAMVNSGGVSTNKNVKWISSAIYTEHNDYGDSGGDYVFDWSTAFAQDKYNDLATFYNEPVTWINSTGTYANKEGGANVFCKGIMQYNDGVSWANGPAMPTTATKDITLSGSGSRTISTRLNGTECFGAMVKHPLDQGSYPSFFYLYYFTRNQPDLDPIGTSSKTITVQASGGTVDFDVTSATASSSLLDEDLILLDATVHNSGDPVQIASVTNTNAGSFTAAPFNPALCGLLGFPGSLCPASSGFSETINTGSNKHLYVLITRSAGASGGTILTFHANTTSSVCGGSSTGTADLDIGTTVPFTCEITPPSLTMATNEVGQFYVACENIAGDSIPCTGSNWYWADGLAGDFMLRTNSEAQAYSTSAPGSDGTLRYRSQMARCLSDIEITSPSNGYDCEFIPPSATINTSTSKYFRLNCFEDGAAHAPDDADYDLVDGLSGSTSNSSTAGTSYDAPGSPTDGRLRGFAQWNDHPPHILGSVAFAEIDVTNGTGDGNETCPDCEGPGGEGSTMWCTIGSGPLNVYPGYSGWIGIMCGKYANETCANVTWSSSGGVSVGGGTDGGVDFTIIGNPGDSCRIEAYVNNTPDQNCWKPCFIGTPECWEFT